MTLDLIIEKLDIDLEYIDDKYIPGTKSRGKSRMNYMKNRGEIVLSKLANEKTKAHEIGHIINFIMGGGYRYSDSVGISSEQFADTIADFLIDVIIKKNILVKK